MDAAYSSENTTNSEAPEVRRAPLAVAASCAVMLVGAGFLAFVMAQTPPGTAREMSAQTSSKVRIALAPIAPGEATREIGQTGKVAGAATPGAQIAPERPERDELIEVELSSKLNPSPPQIAGAGELSGDEIVEVELLPQLKPSLVEAVKAARQAAMRAPPLLALGESFLASEEDAPAPVYFVSDLERRPARDWSLAAAYDGDLIETPQVARITLTRGETFVDAMRRAGVSAADRNAAAYAFGREQNLRKLRPGQEFILTTGTANQTLFQMAAQDHEPETFLLALDFKADAEHRVIVKRTSNGGFEATKASIDLTSRLVSVSGRIDGSLYLSAKNAGAPDAIIASLADIFAYDIDFQRDILGGDEFEAIFEVRFDENGALVGAGEILYGRLTWRGRRKEKGYYRFAGEETAGRFDYFDRAGEGARRLLMKTPIDGARLSSGFGARKHPILGYARAHKGVDFAANRGTPIKAAGAGVVERADRYGGFGNYVRIRHASGYKTAYAHLNGFARGVKAGKRVNQGDIIGYVGTTGASTGPHLHYEVHLNGSAVNPQNLKIATGVSLKGADLKAFRAARDTLDAMRLPAAESTGLLAQDEDQGASL